MSTAASFNRGDSADHPTTATTIPKPNISSMSTSNSSSSNSSHPLSQRIRSILVNTSVDDLATLKAMDTIAELYPAAPHPKTSHRGASDPISNPPIRLIDTETARKNIETESRKRILKATNQFINVLNHVDSHLLNLSDHVQQMNLSCDQVHTKLDQAGESSRYLIEHAEGLEKQRETTKVQQQLSLLFLQRFTLSSQEREAIHSRQVPVGSRLFAVIDRIENIRRDCRVLLEGSDANDVGRGTRAGIDIMSSTADDLQAAYQKIYRWCCFEFRQPIKDGLEVSKNLREAVRRLIHARQDLLRSALSTLVQTRSSILINSFSNALTVGGPAPSFLPRPIELHAHDPTRYVGDMLAWIHQTLASEREFLTALFGEMEGEGGRRIGERRRGLEGSLDLTGSHPEASLLGPGEAMVREVLNRNLEGCCRPLKIRVQQTVRSQEGSVTTYRLAHLVQFYRNTMEKTIGTKAALSQTLKEIAEMSLESFFATLEQQAAGLARFQEMPDSDLSPPPPLVGACATLKELLSEYQLSLADEGPNASDMARPSISTEKADNPQWSLDDFDMILVKMVDPMISMCNRMAELINFRRPRTKSQNEASWQSRIFLANCFVYMMNLLQPYGFTKGKVTEIQQLLQQQMEGLVVGHYHRLLNESGLEPIINAIESKSPDTPLSHYPGTSPSEIQAYFTALNGFLSSTSLIAPPRLALLSSPNLRSTIHRSSLLSLTDTYGRIVDAITNPTNKYEWNQTLIKRSKEEVELLLGLNS